MVVLRFLLLFVLFSVVFVDGIKCYRGAHNKNDLMKKKELNNLRRMYNVYQSHQRKTPQLAGQVPRPAYEIPYYKDTKLTVADAYTIVECKGAETVCSKVENMWDVEKGCIEQSICNKGYKNLNNVDSSLWCCNKELCNESTMSTISWAIVSAVAAFAI